MSSMPPARQKTTVISTVFFQVKDDLVKRWGELEDFGFRFQWKHLWSCVQEFKPLIFQNGKPVPFPEPTKAGLTKLKKHMQRYTHTMTDARNKSEVCEWKKRLKLSDWTRQCFGWASEKHWTEWENFVPGSSKAAHEKACSNWMQVARRFRQRGLELWKMSITKDVSVEMMMHFDSRRKRSQLTVAVS